MALQVTVDDGVAVLTIDRPEKRNALDTATVLALEAFFSDPPEAVLAAVIHGQGAHFCAGLDLSDLAEGDAAAGLRHSRMWHRAFQPIEFGRVPVFAALQGATIGGGLELAASCHVRVADGTAFYALPEGSRGIYVGGGASVRLARLIGVARMQDMMLTGRTYGAEEGERVGFSQYVVPAGEALAKAVSLARRAAENAPLTNYAVLHALPRSAGADPETGLLLESLMAAVAQDTPEAKARLAAFLAGKAAKVRHD
jgi:enoyl-CoA hydratase/carnithine racemase